MAILTRDEQRSVALATLLQGPVYSEEAPQVWATIRNQYGALHDTLRQLGLTLLIDATEEYAYLRSNDTLPEGMPRLMRRHKLSFHTTVLLILIRQRMTQAESQEATPRLILSEDEMVEMMRPYHRPGTNEDRIAMDIARLEDLRYVKRLRGSDGMYEARRIIKAQVTADWLATYAEQLIGSLPQGDSAEDVLVDSKAQG